MTKSSIQTSRRTLLAGAMVLGATAVAAAQDKTARPLGNKGATILGPRDPVRENENPDFVQPPDTDHGAIPKSALLFFRHTYQNARRRLVTRDNRSGATCSQDHRGRQHAPRTWRCARIALA